MGENKGVWKKRHLNQLFEMRPVAISTTLDVMTVCLWSECLKAAVWWAVFTRYWKPLWLAAQFSFTFVLFVFIRFSKLSPSLVNNLRILSQTSETHLSKSWTVFSLLKELRPPLATFSHAKGMSENFKFTLADGSFEVVPAFSRKPRKVTKNKEIHSTILGSCLSVEWELSESGCSEIL